MCPHKNGRDRHVSNPHVCPPPWSLPPSCLFPTGQSWLLRPRISRVVTFPCSGYANRPNRAIDGKGTSTPLVRQPCRLLQQARSYSTGGKPHRQWGLATQVRQREYAAFRGVSWHRLGGIMQLAGRSLILVREHPRSRAPPLEARERGA